MRDAQLGTMYSSIPLIHSSLLIFRPGSTKCSVGAMSRAPMLLAWSPSVTPSIAALSRHHPVHRSLKCSATAKSLGVERWKKCPQMRQNRTRRSTEGLKMMCGSDVHAPKIAKKTCAETIVRHSRPQQILVF